MPNALELLGLKKETRKSSAADILGASEEQKERLKGTPVTETEFDVPLGPTKTQQFVRGGIAGAAQALPFFGPAKKLSPLMQMLLEAGSPAVAEFGMQQAGIAPESTEDIIGAAATPLAIRGLLGLPGAARGLGRVGAQFLAPQQARNVGIETIQQMARPKQSADVLFAIARKQGPVESQPIINTIRRAVNTESRMSTPNRAGIKILTNLRDKLASNPTANYDDLIDEVQRLRQNAQGHFARGNNVTGVTLSKASSEILDEMDRVSPAIKAANAAFRGEAATTAIAKELRKSGAGNAVRNLFDSDTLVSGIFSAQERKEIIDMADRIARIPTGTTLGAANRFIAAFGEPTAEAIQDGRGRQLLKILMQNPNDPTIVNRVGTIILAQFGRGAFARVGSESQNKP